MQGSGSGCDGRGGLVRSVRPLSRVKPEAVPHLRNVVGKFCGPSLVAVVVVVVVVVVLLLLSTDLRIN